MRQFKRSILNLQEYAYFHIKHRLKTKYKQDMKTRFWYFTVVLFLMIACKSSSKLVEQGNYDKAIEKTVKKILKGKADSEDILMLDKAYKLANTRNLEQIKLLKSEGKPENWESVYFQYLALDNRQKQVRKVLPLKLKGQTINYKQVDYTTSIVEAKTKAAEYFYAHGKRLMAFDRKVSYRDAYYSFKKAKKYRASAFPDIDKLIDEAHYYGTTRVLVDAMNNSRVRLPSDFFDKLLAINTNDLNKGWAEYYIGMMDREINYDYMITIMLQNIVFSPEKFDQKEYLREKEVQDGYTYVLDKNGNVMKDSTGNDIKVAKMKELKCTVVERRQFKEISVEAQLEYLELIPSKRVVKLIPVTATSVFENVYGKALGDFEALTKEDLALIERKSMPFPRDGDMIYDCIEPLQVHINEIIYENKGLVN